MERHLIPRAAVWAARTAMMLALAVIIAVPAYFIANYSESANAQAPALFTSINYAEEAQAPVQPTQITQGAQAPIIDSVGGSDGILAQPGGSIGAIRLGRLGQESLSDQRRPTVEAVVAAAATEGTSPNPLPTNQPVPASDQPAEPVGAVGRIITLAELDQYAGQAGWDINSNAWHSMRRIISECEDPSLYTASANLNDPYGGSHGLAQLNYNWFERAGESSDQRYDPVVNLRTALWLYHRLGRFGGGGGWSCATTLGID